MRCRAADEPVTFVDYGLSAFSLTFATEPDLSPPRVRVETHMEVEMLFVEHGIVTQEFAGVAEQVVAGELAVYWAGHPHVTVQVGPGSSYHVAQIPIVDVLTWVGPSPVVDRLLTGEFLRVADVRQEALADGQAFARWTTSLRSGDPWLRTVVELEMQARLRRFIHEIGPNVSATPFKRTGSATAAGVAAAIRYVVRHFMQPITVDQVAKAIGWQRDYLMESFRRVCGLTLWEYVTRVRLTEAQRLLKSTDLPILAVCHRSGFGSVSRMYAAFRRHCGVTPSRYRDP